MYFVYICENIPEHVAILKARRDKEEREKNKKRLKKGPNPL